MTLRALGRRPRVDRERYAGQLALWALSQRSANLRPNANSPARRPGCLRWRVP